MCCFRRSFRSRRRLECKSWACVSYKTINIVIRGTWLLGCEREVYVPDSGRGGGSQFLDIGGCV